jgi:hypothetical protein
MSFIALSSLLACVSLWIPFVARRHVVARIPFAIPFRPTFWCARTMIPPRDLFPCAPHCARMAPMKGSHTGSNSANEHLPQWAIAAGWARPSPTDLAARLRPLSAPPERCRAGLRASEPMFCLLLYNRRGTDLSANRAKHLIPLALKNRDGFEGRHRSVATFYVIIKNGDPATH